MLLARIIARIRACPNISPTSPGSTPTLYSPLGPLNWPPHFTTHAAGRRSWRSGITNPILNALKAQTRTTQARLIFLDDRGSKLAKDEWGEWPALKKGLDFQIKAIQKERDVVFAQAGGEGEPPQVSVELWGDGPISIETFREKLGGT